MATKIFTFLFSLVFGVFGQTFNVPDDLDLNDEKDYKKTETFLIDCIDLVETTPINDKNDNVKLAMTFAIKWITGCPYIIVNVTPVMTKVSKPNSILSIIYLGGWTKSAINNSYELSDVDGNYAGIQSVLEYYKKNKEIERNDLLDELIKYDEDQLKEWIKNELKDAKK